MNELKIVLTRGKTVRIEFDGRQGEISLAYPQTGSPEAHIKTRDDGDIEPYAFVYTKAADHDDNS